MTKVYARFMFEVIGGAKNSEEGKKFVSDFLNKLLAQIRGLPYLKIKKEYTAEPEKQDKFWTTYTEIEAEFDDINSLFNFVIDYAPSSIEVIEPEKIEIRNSDLNAYLNDFAHRMHELGAIINNLRAENLLLKRQLGFKGQFGGFRIKQK